jgi:AraC family ethanolamine operon transcriptional activator
MFTVSVPQAQLESALWDYGRCELLSVLSDCGVTPFPRKVIQNLTEVLKVVTCSTFVMEGKLVELEAEDQILQAICEGLFSQEYQVTARERAKYVFQARHYIDAHLGEVLRVGQIASHVGVSGRTLELAFREVVGVRVVEYIRTRRLSRARQLLLKQPVNDKPITEAATQCGLFHLGYFSRDYGRLFGELPSQTVKRADSRRAQLS